MRSLIKIITLFIAFSLAACSQQWRDSDPGVSGEEVFELLNNLTLSASSQGSGGTLSSEILIHPNTNIYFAQGPGTMGPAITIVAFPELSYLSNQLAGFEDLDLEEAQVFFIDGFDNEGNRKFFLGYNLKIKDTGQESSVMLSAHHAEFTNNGFIADFQTSSGTLRVKSFDVQDDVKDFRSVIQLKVYDISASDELYIGKFPTLVGFGN